MASSFQPSPLNKNSLGDEIVFSIKEMIADGRLQPTQKLPTEQELSQVYGVGRTTVREALMALTALGLVKRRGRGTYVSEAVEYPLREFYLQLMVDHYDIGQLYETRILLEGELAKLACLRATEDHIHKLELCVEQMQSDDIDIYIKADIEYHNTIMLAADNRVIYEMYQVIRLLLEKAQREIVSSQEVRVLSRAQHRQILDAIQKRDPEEALVQMNSHIAAMNNARKKMVG